MRKKILNKILAGVAFLSVASVLFLTSCSKDGEMGLTGATGKNGLNGLNANEVCKTCHTTTVWDTIVDAYKMSKHFYGNTSARNTKYCAGCHTSEGFKQLQNNGIYATTNDMPNASKITCETCHQHSTFDFAADTISDVLFANKPVLLHYNKNLIATDFGKSNNLCANCHQIRGKTATVYTDTTSNTGYPKVTNATFTQLPYFPFAYSWNDVDTVKYLAGRSFSVHDGNQSNLVAGIYGYEYKGVDYSASRTWKHSSFSCVDCHMNKYNATTKTGGHTMNVNIDECSKCHTGDPIGSVEDIIKQKLTILGDLLVTRKVMKKTTNTSGVVSYSAVNTHDFNGKLYMYNDSITKYATSSSMNTVSPTNGLVIYGNILRYAVDTDRANRKGNFWQYGELGAAYNFTYINTLNAYGVHNPTYARKLLDESINWLNSHPTLPNGTKKK